MSQIQRTLLIVDDSLEDCDLYRRYLLRDQTYHYKIVTAESGQQGLALWQQHQPDAVLLDYRLSDLDGLEFLEQLRLKTRQLFLPVIVITGQGNETIAVQAMKAGAQDYLVKEKTTPEVLQLAINKAIATIQLHTQLQQHIKRERLLAETTSQIHRSLNLDEIFQTTVTRIRQFLQTDRVLILQVQPDGYSTVAAEAVGAEWQPLLSSSLYDPCLAHNIPDQPASAAADPNQAKHDWEQKNRGKNDRGSLDCQNGVTTKLEATAKSNIHDGSMDPCHVDLLAQFQVQAYLVVPIPQEDQVLGLLIAHHCASTRSWQSFEIEALQQLAIQVSIALRQASLYQQAQHELAERQQVETALRCANERFELAAAAVDCLIYEWDLQTHRVERSQGLTQLLGYTQTEVEATAEWWRDRIHPEDFQSIQEHFKANFSETDRFCCEYRVHHKQGHYVWVEDRSIVVRDQMDQPIRLVGSTTNINDRKRAELNGQFLTQLDLRLRQLSTVEDMIAEITRSLGHYLTADRCCFGKVDWERGWITIHNCWQRTSEDPTDPDTFPISVFAAPDFQATLLAGQVAVVKDVTTDPRTRAYTNNYERAGVRAFICMPCLYAGRWVAILSLESQTPRVWCEDEWTLIQETTTRTWSLLEQTRAIETLRESEARLKLAQKATKSGLWDWNIETGMVNIAEEYCALFGLDPTIREITYEACLDQIYPDDRTRVEQQLRHVFQEHQQDYGEEYRISLPDGIHWLSSKAQVFYDPTGNAVRMIGYVQDITDRKQVEVELHENRAQLQQQLAEIEVIYRTAPIGLSILDPDLRFVRINQRLAEINGYPVEAHIGRTVRELLPDLADAAEKILCAILDTGEPQLNVEIQGTTPAQPGIQRIWLEHFLPLKDGDRTIGISIVCEEITDRKRAEQEREILLEREQAARTEAEHANQVKDEFLAILSHELRSPLNPILGWAKLLQTRKFDQAKTAEALATIERNGKLLTQLIDDLLDVAKILRGKLSLNAAPVNLASVSESAIETVRTAAVAKSILLRAELPNVGQVSGDATRLQQIVWNLLSNAIKFTPEGGRVEIRLDRVGNQAQLRVTDTGKGISSAFLPHIFESFRQEDISTTRKYGGLGLGLAIVRYLVEAHGGTIVADSPGDEQGASFTVYLPLLAGGSEITSTTKGLEPELNLGGIRVLTVDDEPDTREVLKVLLTQRGAEVMTVASASESLVALETFQPDILVSDIGMPNVDGYGLLQQLRSLPAEKGGQIPAIALTAYAGEIDQQRALAAGFQTHISKPIDPDQLIATILDLLHSPFDRHP